MLWENLREEEFKSAIEKSHGVCAMAMGCIEKHGQHLPLGTDTLKAGKILELAAEREEVCVFPKLYFGNLQGKQQTHIGDENFQYGFVALSTELLNSLLEEICDEIGRNGFNKIFLFSGHGGNLSWLNQFLASVLAKKKNYEVFLGRNRLIMPSDILEVIAKEGREKFPYLTDSDIKVLEDFVRDGKYDGHGGFAETAQVLKTYPELVRLDRCEAESGLHTGRCNFLGDNGIVWGRTWFYDYPNSYAGHAPVGLTPTIAEAAVEIAVERTVKALKTLKNDELMSRIM